MVMVLAPLTLLLHAAVEARDEVKDKRFNQGGVFFLSVKKRTRAHVVVVNMTEKVIPAFKITCLTQTQMNKPVKLILFHPPANKNNGLLAVQSKC